MIEIECGLPGCLKWCYLQCSKCKKVKYCCRDHQKLDWASHKKTCDAPRPNIPEAIPQNVRMIPSLLYAKMLTESLENDQYPVEDVEKIFGIKMVGRNIPYTTGLNEFETGTLVYNCWAFIYKSYIKEALGLVDEGDRAVLRQIMGLATTNLTREIASALYYGRLPEFFETILYRLDVVWTSKLGFNRDVYYRELLRRDFQGILWEPFQHTKSVVDQY